MNNTQIDTVKAMLRGDKVVSAGAFYAAGVNPAALRRAVDQKIALPYSRGIYVSSDAPFPDNVGFAAISLVNPGGVVCMASAAAFHRLSDESPSEIWYAVDVAKVRRHLGGINRDPVRTLFWSAAALIHGVEEIDAGGVAVRITGRARTVLDLLRYRTKIGDEPGLKALKDYAVAGDDVGEIWRLADALGCAHQIESFMRVAEEMQTAVPMRTP